MQESYTDILGTIYDLISDADDKISMHIVLSSSTEQVRQQGNIAREYLKNAMQLTLELNKRIREDRQKGVLTP